VLSMMVGGLLIRHYGLRTVQRLREALRTGVPPAGRNTPGLVGVLAGILLILPGFLSDLAAILLLIPAVRRFFASSLGWQMSSFAVGRRGSAGARGGPIIEAEAVEIRGEIRSERPVGRSSPWQR
jgi:UPF0716 protein FxsA